MRKNKSERILLGVGHGISIKGKRKDYIKSMTKDFKITITMFDPAVTNGKLYVIRSEADYDDMKIELVK